MRTPFCPSFSPPPFPSPARTSLSLSPTGRGQGAPESGARSGPGPSVCTSSSGFPTCPVLVPTGLLHLPTCHHHPERRWGRQSLTLLCRSSSRQQTAEFSAPGSYEVGEVSGQLHSLGGQWEVGVGGRGRGKGRRREGAEQGTGKGNKGGERAVTHPQESPLGLTAWGLQVKGGRCL